MDIVATVEEEAVVLPDEPGFRPSTNARRGFQIQDVYALGETSVRISLCSSLLKES